MSKASTKKYLFRSNLFDVYGTYEAMEAEYLSAFANPGDPVTEEEVFATLRNDLDDVYSDLMYELGFHRGNYLVKGDLGFWFGRRDGGKLFEDMSLKEVIQQIIDSADDFEIYYVDRVLHIDTHGHDGSSYFTVYLVTDKGMRWYENNKDYYEERHLHDHILSVKCYRKNIPSCA